MDGGGRWTADSVYRHRRCGLLWADHVNTGPPWYWPRCPDEADHPAEPPDGDDSGRSR